MELVRALIASPVESLLKSYRAFLSQHGFAVVTAADALDCVANLRDFEPHVLVLDDELQWGRTSGVLASLDEDPSLPSVQVIVLAASHDREIESMLASKARGELHLKPMDPSTLAERIRSIVNRANMETPN
jgi:DNA-binding response OmpR family regulator